MATTTTTNAFTSQSPLVYFLAGALLPSLAWYFLLPKPKSKSSTETKPKPSSKSSSSNTTGGGDPSSTEGSGSEDEEDEDIAGTTVGGPSSEWGYSDAPYKMVFCVNQDLKMGKGKIAAQCCHAAVACYKRASKQCPAAVKAWEWTGCAKIALKCPTQEEMERIATLAIERDIPAYLVEDAGRTQIAAGSRTVLGLGPAPAYVFEEVTSHLKLM